MSLSPMPAAEASSSLRHAIAMRMARCIGPKPATAMICG
ncbi:UNVERIFIED_ORG: hypothetical protein J2R84_007715 [Bradyrhizobium japonicum]